jgi:ribosome biogenesis GTPase
LEETNLNNLKEWGLNPFIEALYGNETMYLGRVVKQLRNQYQLISEETFLIGEVSGKFKFECESLSDFPVVGDWVIIDRMSDQGGQAIIHKVLRRSSSFSRKVAGRRSDEQILASNLDKVFICMSLNLDYHIGKLERFIAQTWESGATPVVVMTKSDLCDDLELKKQEVENVSFGINVHYVSSYDLSGVSDFVEELHPGKTYAFIGASGVGKSTLINVLLGEELQDTGGLRNDDKGRHTTTNREMFILPSGAIVVDTPGMRELGMYKSDQGISQTFEDIENYASQCKFSDCTHTNEPGCCVIEAIETGDLTVERFNSYLKLMKENAYLDRKLRRSKHEEHKKFLKSISKHRKNL